MTASESSAAARTPNVRTVQLTITTTYLAAIDRGYLLHTNPSQFPWYEMSFGRAHALCPESEIDLCRACVLLAWRNEHAEQCGEKMVVKPLEFKVESFRER
jgi:hypothetical protein